MEASKGVCPVGGAGGNRRYVQWRPVKGCVQWEGLSYGGGGSSH